MLLSQTDVYAQPNPDTALIRQWVDSGNALAYSDAQRALQFGTNAVAASGDDYAFGKLNGLQVLGEAYYHIGQLDSALYYYDQALRFSIMTGNKDETGNNHTGIASILMESGDLDSAIVHYDDAIGIFWAISDSLALSDAILRRGNVHSSMGNHDEAMASFMECLKISEALDRRAYIGYSLGAIGIIHDKQGNYQTSEEYFLRAMEIFTELGDIYGQIGYANNLGILNKNMGRFEKSMSYYDQCLMLSDSIDFDRGRLSAHTNLGILNEKMGRFESAVYHASQGLEYALKMQANETYADNLNSIARAQMGLKSYSEALENAEEALRIGTEVGSLEKQRDATLTLSEITRAIGDFERSLAYYMSHTQIRDSLYNVEKAKQISELQTVYETEKKDNEIKLLAKNAEIDRIRKTRLWVALGLSLFAGGLLVYAQRIRRVRDKKILSQEKALETERRRTAEAESARINRELDFKKQELAAKALQLARKNEFLQSLNEEVLKMKDQAQGLVADSARTISRKIHLDIESEEDWEQFLASFRDVHRDFIENLQREFPEISKAELRLACLMKMNLSGKEIASMLNITQDGVKKARYRLRKRLALESDIDIQQFLMTYPHIAS